MQIKTNNKIDWSKYVDYIFCMNYMPNNRINKISKTLTDIGINIYDNRFFSFIYDNEHKLFLDEIDSIRKKSYSFFNNHTIWEGNFLDNNNQDYVIYVGLTTYKTLKIAQHFNYERIIIFEDDLIFLKDINYIINAMDFVKTQTFDMCLCQTTFEHAWHGIKSYLIENEYGIDLHNDMFLKTYKPTGVYGGGFIILTKEGINKILTFFESNNFVICLDAFDNYRHLLNLETLYALKPLCIQEQMVNLPIELLTHKNANINIEEYIN